MKDLKIDWFADNVLDAVQATVDEVSEEGAEKIAEEARSVLMAKAKYPSGNLADEIEVKISRFKGGGYIVQAQGPGNYTRYYASFVELGSIHNPEPVPYMRQGLKKNRTKIQNEFKNRLVARLRRER
jgi:HK97 gp10 family phage protein